MLDTLLKPMLSASRCRCRVLVGDSRGATWKSRQQGGGNTISEQGLAVDIYYQLVTGNIPICDIQNHELVTGNIPICDIRYHRLVMKYIGWVETNTMSL
jgi:hypothetical protein